MNFAAMTREELRDEARHLAHLKEQEAIELELQGSDTAYLMAWGEQQAWMKLAYGLVERLPLVS